jgi:hypothetical protein
VKPSAFYFLNPDSYSFALVGVVDKGKSDLLCWRLGGGRKEEGEKRKEKRKEK